jgi:hypothetical protein
MQLERSVYSTSEFKKQSKYFVFCKINTDNNPDVAKQWGVGGIPDIRFVDKNLKEKSRILGYKPTGEFVAEMDKARGAR